ncbi:MAG: cysteine desulfurase [Clostridiales bacterium]|nr:cysteine desulfurase [Clostridiales bacterium]
MKEAYLDNSATTAVCPEAAERAAKLMLCCYGNPSSLHRLGAAAQRELDTARAEVARLIGVRPETLIFTSGGTEANNLALFGAAAARRRAGKRIVTTAVEHASVAAACEELERQGYEVVRLKPDADGRIEAEQLEQACTADTILCSVMMVNNETGAIFPVRELAAAARRRAPEVLFHCDAVQAAGKLALHAGRLDVDLMTLSGHKLHAPKGVGALYIRKGARLLPRTFGGGQERGLRPGTEPVPLIAAFGAAAAALPPPQEQARHYETLRRYLLEGLKDRNDVVWHLPANAAPYIVNLSVPGIRSETMLHFLAERGVYISSGSACSKGKRSPVLTAMGLPPAEIDSALRISFSRYNTKEDIDRLIRGITAGAEALVRA